MGSWCGGEWSWEWQWRRPLRDRESSLLRDLCVFINRYTLSKDEADAWEWRNSGSKRYSVKDGYRMLLEREHGSAGSEAFIYSKLWSSGATSKAQVLSWRVIMERLPTKVELMRRNSLPPNADSRCCFCKAKEESLRHILFECSVSSIIWYDVASWMRTFMVPPNNPGTHFDLKRVLNCPYQYYITFEAHDATRDFTQSFQAIVAICFPTTKQEVQLVQIRKPLRPFCPPKAMSQLFVN